MVARPRSRRASAASSSASESTSLYTLSTARCASLAAMPTASICRRARRLPRWRPDDCTLAMASAARASSIARSSRRRATAASMLGSSWPRLASRWRTCASDSSRRASSFNPSTYAELFEAIGAPWHPALCTRHLAPEHLAPAQLYRPKRVMSGLVFPTTDRAI